MSLPWPYDSDEEEFTEVVDTQEIAIKERLGHTGAEDRHTCISTPVYNTLSRFSSSWSMRFSVTCTLDSDVFTFLTFETLDDSLRTWQAKSSSERLVLNVAELVELALALTTGYLNLTSYRAVPGIKQGGQ